MVASPNDETRTPSIPKLHEVLEATLVPDEPVYDVVPITNEENTPQPWWKRHLKCMSGGTLLLIVGLAGTVGVLLSSKNSVNDEASNVMELSNPPIQSTSSSPSQVATLRQTFKPSPIQSIAPSTSTSLQPSTSFAPTKPPSLQPTQPPTAKT